MTAVSLNVGGGVRLIKPAKLYMCMQNTTNTTRTGARCRMCAAMVLYRWATRGTSLQELEHTHTQSWLCFSLRRLKDQASIICKQATTIIGHYHTIILRPSCTPRPKWNTYIPNLFCIRSSCWKFLWSCIHPPYKNSAECYLMCLTPPPTHSHKTKL